MKNKDGIFVQCYSCLHHDYGVCAAFPKGIPGKIWDGSLKHKNVLVGEQVEPIVYTPDPEIIEAENFFKNEGER